MKTGNLKLVKRNVASVLLTTSFIISITAATEAMSVPFNAAMPIQEFLTPTTTPDYAGRCSPADAELFQGTITGTGRSSFGNVSVEASDCITPTQNSFVFNDGKMIFTLLSGEWSGDEIFANYHGEFTPTGVLSIFKFTDAVFQITGGTGDFLNAKGDGKFLGGEDILSGKGLVFMTGKISNFDNDRDDDEDDDKDRKKKNKGDKESDRDDRKKNGDGREKNGDGREKDEGRAEKSKADRHIAGSANSLALTGGSSNATMTTRLDSGLFPNKQSAGQTIGEFFYQDSSGQLLAINALPEVGSLSLLGIGLVSLLVIRRRKLENSTSAIDPATGR